VERTILFPLILILILMQSNVIILWRKERKRERERIHVEGGEMLESKIPYATRGALLYYDPNPYPPSPSYLM
jgi:hypothetical protein